MYLLEGRVKTSWPLGTYSMELKLNLELYFSRMLFQLQILHLPPNREITHWLHLAQRLDIFILF